MADPVISVQAVRRRLQLHHHRSTVLVTFGPIIVLVAALASMAGLLRIPNVALLTGLGAFLLTSVAQFRARRWIHGPSPNTTWSPRPMPLLVRATGGLRVHGPTIWHLSPDQSSALGGPETDPGGLLTLIALVRSASRKLRPYLVAYVLEQAARHARLGRGHLCRDHAFDWAWQLLAELRRTHERGGDQVLEHVDPQCLNDLLRAAAPDDDSIPLRERLGAALHVDGDVAATLATLLDVRQPLPRLLDVARATLEQQQPHTAAA